MKSRLLRRALVGVLLCFGGFFLSWLPGTSFRQTTVIVDAGGCRMVTDVIDTGDDTQGSVLLFHGLVGNKKIMSYVAQGFALQNLLVFVPDLPGHGRTPGPFSFARSVACADAFTHQLIARGAIDASSTLVAGHSMGGAIALMVGSRSPVAGVVAISPAPMTPNHGVQSEMLLWSGPPRLPGNTLVLSGGLELEAMRANAQDLVKEQGAGAVPPAEFSVIPWATHSGLIFSAETSRRAADWATHVLRIAPRTKQPSRSALLGWAVGLVGLLLIAGPFIREFTASAEGADRTARGNGNSKVRAFCGFGLGSLAAVVLLRHIDLLRFLQLYGGSYMATLFLTAGAIALILQWKQLPQCAASLVTDWKANAKAAAAGVALIILFSAWCDLSLSESWLSLSRWLRLPAVLLAFWPFHIAMELFLGPAEIGRLGRRWFLGTVLFGATWAIFVAGMIHFRTGMALLPLLTPGILLVGGLVRAGVDVVRKSTDSATAAALFGAILLAGFCLVVFPIT